MLLLIALVSLGKILPKIHPPSPRNSYDQLRNPKSPVVEEQYHAFWMRVAPPRIPELGQQGSFT